MVACLGQSATGQFTIWPSMHRTGLVRARYEAYNLVMKTVWSFKSRKRCMPLLQVRLGLFY